MTKDRWLSLMQAMKLDASLPCYESLLSAYSEAHRHYHTCSHISAMLRHFDQSITECKYPNEVELAIWFHDAVYKPFSSSNELDSAKWAKEFLYSANYKEDGIERVHQLIMATLHNGEAFTDDAKLLVDIDLSILGVPETTYDEFEKNIRKEYHLVPAIIYRQKRKQLLSSFLERQFIYNTVRYQEQYETQARENLERAMHKL
ncbi:MAG: HD domain-containing protein [Cellvibrionaceae bacterium]